MNPLSSGNQIYSANGSTWFGDDYFDVPFYVYGPTLAATNNISFGGQQGHEYRVEMTLSGTVGTVTIRVGNGARYTYSAGASVSERIIYLSGSSIVNVLPSSDFNGTITNFNIYETYGV